jgi:hypothetical protein
MEADVGATLFPSWWRILNKATDPVQSRRYQSAKALLKDMESLRVRLSMTSVFGSWLMRGAMRGVSVVVIALLTIFIAFKLYAWKMIKETIPPEERGSMWEFFMEF